jgi:starch phosphorylase
LEASGTGNMKFALNGALTIGTFDGANIEIHDHVGAENILIFGLRADEVAQKRRTGYAPGQVVATTPALAETLAAIRGGVFSPDDPQRYAGLVDDLVNNDHFLVTADFAAYAAKQREVDALFRQQSVWAAKAITNTAKMGWFSADRAIREYASEIWKATAG